MEHFKNILIVLLAIALYSCAGKSYNIETKTYIEDKVIPLAELIKQNHNINNEVPADANLKYYMEVEMPEAGVSQQILNNIQDTIKGYIISRGCDSVVLTMNVEQAIAADKEFWEKYYLEDCSTKLEDFKHIEEESEYVPILTMEP